MFFSTWGSAMWDDRLKEVLCETAEQMFFSEFAEAPDQEVPVQVHWATVRVRSPTEFEVIVAAEPERIEAAVALLFLEREVSQARSLDVVAELANTIAGSLSRHISSDAALDFSPPDKGCGEAPEFDNYHAFTADELTLYVAIRPLQGAA